MPNITEITFKATSDYGYDLFKRKNADYGDSAEKSLEKYGLLPNLIRLDDKINRAETLIKRGAKVADESLYDTLVDLGNYAYMFATYIKNNEKGEKHYATRAKQCPDSDRLSHGFFRG